MDLGDAEGYIGRRVVYRPYGAPSRVEYGFITEVRGKWVFVRYGNDATAKATAPQDLELV
jgi:ribosomal protein L35AE/L33A